MFIEITQKDRNGEITNVLLNINSIDSIVYQSDGGVKMYDKQGNEFYQVMNSFFDIRSRLKAAGLYV